MHTVLDQLLVQSKDVDVLAQEGGGGEGRGVVVRPDEGGYLHVKEKELQVLGVGLRVDEGLLEDLGGQATLNVVVSERREDGCLI